MPHRNNGGNTENHTFIEFPVTDNINQVPPCISNCRQTISGNIQTVDPITESTISTNKRQYTNNKKLLEENQSDTKGQKSFCKDKKRTCVERNTINKRYLGDSILEASKVTKYLTVKSGMGTGKTTAMRAIIKALPIDSNILFISPRKKLNFAMSYDLDIAYYEDVKKEENKDIKESMARRMVVTPQSLGAILKEFPEINYKYIVMDESEAIASMIVSSVTKDKVETLQALRKASQLAQHVIAMDAHLARQSKKLMALLADDQPIKQLINTAKTWLFDVNLLVGGSYVQRRDKNNAMQEKAIKAGKTIAICSNSKSYCESRHTVITNLYPELKVLLITGDSSKKAQYLLSNPNSISNWDVVIFSPAVSVGVSFDIENHVNQIFGNFVNTLNTGGSDDAIQALARVRKPTDKKWTISLDNEKEIFSHAPQLPADITNAITDRLSRACFLGAVKNINVTDAESRVMELYATCEHARVHDKNNFNNNFISRLEDMGCRINEVEIKDIDANMKASKQLAADHKEIKRTEEIEIKTTSTKIDETEYDRIRAKKKFRHDEVTQEEDNSLKRYVFEAKYSIDCDEINQEKLAIYLEHDDNGTISKLINREISLCDKGFIKRYMKARVVGLGEDQAFLVDALSDKLNTPMIRNLLKYALPYVDGKEYSHKSLKRSAMLQYVKRHYEEITALRIITLPKGWKFKPALLMNHLLELMGYEHESEQRREGKKRIYIFNAVKNDAIESLHKNRAKNGKDWITSTENIMYLYEVVREEKPELSDIELSEELYKIAAESGW